MADTDKLRMYAPSPTPVIDTDVLRFVVGELQKVSQTTASIARVLKALEARVAALEP